MAVNAEVQKTGSENTLSMIRKFSRRVQGAGLVKTVRGRRYHSRDTSKIVKKKRALKLIKRRADFRKLVKEGKVAEPTPRGHRPSSSRESSSPQARFEGTPIAR